jgi:hypothetical protein
MPTGSVIQTVTAAISTNASTTSSSAGATGLTASITPIATTSKILITTTIAGAYATGTGKELVFYLYKNGSSLVNYIGDIYVNGANIISTQSFNYIDSPSTTSSTTYAIYFSISAGGTGQINSSGGQVSTITLQELKF